MATCRGRSRTNIVVFFQGGGGGGGNQPVQPAHAHEAQRHCPLNLGHVNISIRIHFREGGGVPGPPHGAATGPLIVSLGGIIASSLCQFDECCSLLVPESYCSSQTLQSG